MENFDGIFEMMTKPGERLAADMKRLGGGILVLGAGGKIGPALAAKAKRGFEKAGLGHKVTAASLFTFPAEAERMRAAGAEVMEGDLADEKFLASLPDAENIIYMAGRKFGTQGDEAETWNVNALLPAKVCERFPRSRIVFFSTGNVYGEAPLASGGSAETDVLRPVGEYAQSCLARERVMEHYCAKNGTRMLAFRLNYAIEARYGVLYDIARKVMDGAPVDLRQGVFNCIWQGDVCEYAIRSLLYAAAPMERLNVTGPEALSVRRTAEYFGRAFGRQPLFTGTEGDSALFSSSAKMAALMGYPSVPPLTMMELVADWVSSGGAGLGAPTHFETTDGKY